MNWSDVSWSNLNAISKTWALFLKWKLGCLGATWVLDFGWTSGNLGVFKRWKELSFTLHDYEYFSNLSSKNLVGFGHKLSFIKRYIGLKIEDLGSFSTWPPLKTDRILVTALTPSMTSHRIMYQWLDMGIFLRKNFGSSIAWVPTSKKRASGTLGIVLFQHHHQSPIQYIIHK